MLAIRPVMNVAALGVGLLFADVAGAQQTPGIEPAVKTGQSIAGKYLVTPKCACLPPEVRLSLALLSSRIGLISDKNFNTAHDAQVACDLELADLRSGAREEVNNAVLAKVRKACTNFPKVDADCGDRKATCKAVDTSGYSIDQIDVDKIACTILPNEGKFTFEIRGIATYRGTFDVLCDP